MPVPIFIYVCLLAGFTSTDLTATTVNVSDSHIAVLIPTTSKDRSFTINVYREKDQEFVVTEDEMWDQDAKTDDVEKKIEEKKTSEDPKLIK